MWHLRLILTCTLLVLTLAGCGASRTIVLEPKKDAKARFEAAQVVHVEDNVPVAPEIDSYFLKHLTKQLFEEGPFTKGEGLRIEYRFVSYDGGSRFARYMLGGLGNAGEASAVIELVFRSPNGDELAKIQTEGKIGSGIFGGSSKSTVKKAAKEAAAFAISNFYGG